MKTCIVTTIWLGDEAYKQKLIKLLGYYLTQCKDLKFSEIIVIDNASDEKEIQKIEALMIGEPVRFIRNSEHFDRPSHLSYKYLWRAVYTLKDILKTYDKIIYIDSDFYILSSKMTNYINNLNSGWTTFWCTKHGFPETGCHILVNGTKQYENFVNKSWDQFVQDNNNMVMETRLPVTNVEKNMIGNRWSEYPKDIPEEADFSAQTLLETKVKFK